MPAADATVKEAKAGVKRATASLDRWESESKRITGLVRGGVVDRQTQDETDNQFRAAGAGREEAQARVGSAEAMALKSRAERDKAEADVNTALSRLEVAKANERQHGAMLQYAKVRTPFDGVVTRLCGDRASLDDFTRLAESRWLALAALGQSPEPGLVILGNDGHSCGWVTAVFETALAALEKGLYEWFADRGIEPQDYPPFSWKEGGKACPHAPSGAHARRGFAGKPVRFRQKTASRQKDAQDGK